MRRPRPAPAPGLALGAPAAADAERAAQRRPAARLRGLAPPVSSTARSTGVAARRSPTCAKCEQQSLHLARDARARSRAPHRRRHVEALFGTRSSRRLLPRARHLGRPRRDPGHARRADGQRLPAVVGCCSIGAARSASRTRATRTRATLSALRACTRRARCRSTPWACASAPTCCAASHAYVQNAEPPVPVLTVTMSIERRREACSMWPSASPTSCRSSRTTHEKPSSIFAARPLPALKSLDVRGRVTLHGQPVEDAVVLAWPHRPTWWRWRASRHRSSCARRPGGRPRSTPAPAGQAATRTSRRAPRSRPGG